ncbi:MAG: MBL fold metallo-hydrolase [Bacteroidota bacterium]|nr:MBL fold metallo-hydrolase [Bacteroidota bacterium]
MRTTIVKHLLLIAGILSAGIASASTFATDTFKTRSNKEVTITFIKHGSLMLTYNHEFIQVDPVSGYADYTTFPKADVILVTHEHSDHLDAKAINELTKKGTSLFTNEAVSKQLGKGTALKNGARITISGQIRLEAVPAYNTTPGREKYHPRHRDNGYVLTIDGLRIYIAGDTEIIPEMKQLKHIDIAFLPVNQPYTMTISQAVSAAKLMAPRILYPYHYGNTDIIKLKEGLKGTKIDVRIREME